MLATPFAERKEQLKKIGFEGAHIDKMLQENPNTDINILLDQLLNRPSQQRKFTPSSVDWMTETMQLELAKQISLGQEPAIKGCQLGIPVGLANVGNSCYFNCLLQTYFWNPVFMSTILRVKPSKNGNNNSPNPLIQHLKDVLGQMIVATSQYINPKEVLKALVDDNGQPVLIGEQKDICEISQLFLARISEGLGCDNQNIFTSKILKYEFRNEMIQKQFIGMISNDINQILGQNNNATKMTNKLATQTEEFTFITLNIGDTNRANLNLAWKDQFNQEILYRVHDNVPQINAIKQSSIIRLPQTLCFLIQRYKYCPIQKQSIKLNQVFKFPLEVSVSYLLHPSVNQTAQEGQQKIYDELQEARSLCEKAEIIENTKVAWAMDTVIQHLNNQKVKDAKLMEHIEYLKKQQGKIPSKDYQSLRIQEVSKKLWQATKNLKESHVYFLQAIIMHDGTAQFGHYYAYIQDFENNIWWRYSDTTVTEISQAEVLMNAYGRNEAGAYFLHYVSTPFPSIVNVSPTRAFKQGSNIHSYYHSLLQQLQQ